MASKCSPRPRYLARLGNYEGHEAVWVPEGLRVLCPSCLGTQRALQAWEAALDLISGRAMGTHREPQYVGTWMICSGLGWENLMGLGCIRRVLRGR